MPIEYGEASSFTLIINIKYLGVSARTQCIAPGLWIQLLGDEMPISHSGCGLNLPMSIWAWSSVHGHGCVTERKEVSDQTSSPIQSLHQLITSSPLCHCRTWTLLQRAARLELEEPDKK